MGEPNRQTDLWPPGLELFDWLKLSLQSDDETARLLALEELSGKQLPADLLPIVKSISENDSSEACRKLALQKVWNQKQQEEFDAIVQGFETTPQGFNSLLPSLSPQFRRAILRVAWKSPGEELLNIWRDQLLSEASPEILTVGLNLLAQHGRESDGNLGLTFADSPHADVVVAALDLLYAKAPGLLKVCLPAALRSRNNDIRFHAIRRLAPINVREALRYLNSAIDSNNPLARRRSIEELSLLSAEDAEPSFIRILGLESQPCFW